MAGAALRRRLTWSIADVVGVVVENPTVRSIVLEVPAWPGHLPGQHLDLRLTAEDGYQAQRSYSIATPANGESVTITVEMVDDGEVSPYLTEELRTGDRIEVRGPIGGYFVWDTSSTRPLFLVGGGSGVVPLMSMVRAWSEVGSAVPVRYLASARTFDRLIYFQELEVLAAADRELRLTHTLTRSHPDDWTGPTRRIDSEMLSGSGFDPSDSPEIFVCGPTGFVESVAQTLVTDGHRPEDIKTERFGPSGG
ncbi:MAG TPA: ferredoxin reductase [Acidimicrobiia bacterium]|nr:ferredoxin reductase [Acidimicrobiia bacterium]